MLNRDKKPLNSEMKLELAKSIAEKGESIKKTYANVENTLVKAFRTISGWIDFVLFNQQFAKLTALCLAIVMYLIINGGAKDALFMNNIKQSVELKNIAVITDISESSYEIIGLPETVDVMVRGDASDVQFALQQQSNYKIMANLNELKLGRQEVTLEPQNFSDKVDVTVNPSTAVVTIKQKIARKFSIGYDFINTNKLDKIYSLGEPQFEQNEVTVRASEDTMDQISFVKALIDLEGVKADFVQEATLVAFDQNGMRVDVDILPATVNVKVGVTKPNKEVPITLIPQGSLPDGKAIDSFTLDHSSITIYAPQDVLDSLSEVEVHVPVNKIKEDTTITMPIMLPNGVSTGSVTKVKIALKVKDAETKDIENVPITYQNYNSNFKIVLGDEKATTTVSVTGSKSVLEKIKSEHINVVLDLAEYNKAGTYEVKLKVNGNNPLATYSLKTKTIRITLEEK